MKPLDRVTLLLLTLVVAVGCAETKVTSRDSYMGPKLARPDRIIIVFMGYFVSIDKGSGVKRVVLGFGSGSAELGTEVEGYLMTKQGLRRLGEGEVEATTGKAPGSATVPLAVAVVSGNPVGLVVSGAAKAEGELTGRTTIEGDAKRTAKEVGDQLKIAFQRQGWV
jgi:hypothetical protein